MRHWNIKSIRANFQIRTRPLETNAPWKLELPRAPLRDQLGTPDRYRFAGLGSTILLNRIAIFYLAPELTGSARVKVYPRRNSSIGCWGQGWPRLKAMACGSGREVGHDRSRATHS